MVGGRRLQAVENVLLQRIVWRQERREKRSDDHKRHDAQSDPRRLVGVEGPQQRRQTGWRSS
jgi:hypothetical protein